MLNQRKNEVLSDENFVQLTMLVFSMSAVVREMHEKIEKLEKNNTENPCITEGFYKYSRN